MIPNFLLQVITNRTLSVVAFFFFLLNFQIKDVESSKLGFSKSSDGKQSSFVTIFSLWNTMMGTSFLSIPWGIEKGGIIPFLIFLTTLAAISFYTAYRLIQIYEAYEDSVITDLPSLCYHLLGRWAQVLCVVFSVIVLLGVGIVYYILLCNFLYNFVDFIHTAVNDEVNNFDSNAICPALNSSASDYLDSGNESFRSTWHINNTVPLFLAVLMGPLICFRSPTFFTKFNSFGTFSVVYIFVFVVAKWVKFGTHLSVDKNSIHYSSLFNSEWPTLSGSLSLAFFIHPAVLTVMKNNRVQANNRLHLCIAYIFVTLTFFILGGIFYMAFPLEKSCLEDNFLNNFLSVDTWSFVGRIFLFLQLFTVYPLITYILRVQPYQTIFKQEPTLLYTLVSNATILTVCVCFAIWLPKIGTIIRFVGAFCSVVCVYLLPLGLFYRWQQRLHTTNYFLTGVHLILLILAVANFILQFSVSS